MKSIRYRASAALGEPRHVRPQRLGGNTAVDPKYCGGHKVEPRSGQTHKGQSYGESYPGEPLVGRITPKDRHKRPDRHAERPVELFKRNRQWLKRGTFKVRAVIGWLQQCAQGKSAESTKPAPKRCRIPTRARYTLATKGQSDSVSKEVTFRLILPQFGRYSVACVACCVAAFRKTAAGCTSRRKPSPS